MRIAVSASMEFYGEKVKIVNWTKDGLKVIRSKTGLKVIIDKGPEFCDEPNYLEAKPGTNQFGIMTENGMYYYQGE